VIIKNNNFIFHCHPRPQVFQQNESSPKSKKIGNHWINCIAVYYLYLLQGS